ncbi:MAG: hypothetical protein ACRDC6_09625 [Shewanella sp.]
MYYWNRDNFEGLKAVGDKYSALEGYELFGKYCLQKEQGLKKQANATVNEFVTRCKNQPLAEQRMIAVELLSLGYWNREIHQLLAYPVIAFLKELLAQWVVEEPNHSIPHRWLGYINEDITSYERALELDPTDEISLTQVVISYLKSVDFQTHHLSESILLGDMIRAKNLLSSAQLLNNRLQTEDIKLTLQKSLDYYQCLLNCWEEYSSLGVVEPFPDWCAAKGEQFDFWSVIYYQR